MWKSLGLLAVGLALGGGIWLFNKGEPAPKSLLVSGADAQGVDIQKSLAALDQRVRELTSEVRVLQQAAGRPVTAGGRTPGANGGRPGAGAAPGDRQTRTPADIAAMRERYQQQQNERIIAAGLTPERLQAINRRSEELRVAAMQAQYEAQRTGQKVENVNTQQALRKELGDTEYEHYLKATGQPTQVRIMDVLATSAAERSGIKPGDEIVSYGGTKVFDARDLNTLTTQGAAGGSVTVEVKRDGQTVQLSVPRGPLGVQAGAGGRTAQGGQGGFRNGRQAQGGRTGAQ